MENNLTKEELDRFSAHLVYCYGNHQKQSDEAETPFFLARLRARINEEQQISQLWESGVVKAHRWLVAFTVVAVLFFCGNLLAVGTQFQGADLPPAGQSSIEQDDNYLPHSAEEVLTVDEFQKE